MNQNHGKKKLDPKLVKRLRSEDEITVLKALGELRSSGHLAYLPELLNLLKDSGSEIIRKELVRFIADIKKKTVVHYIVAGMKNPDLVSVRSDIASAAWQSGIDYGAHLDVFIQIFLESNYMTSLECFSVIEQSMEHLTSDEIEQHSKLVLDGLEGISEEKKPLARELVNLFRA